MTEIDVSSFPAPTAAADDESADARQPEARLAAGSRSGLTRDFTATVFVVWRGKIMLHRHRKLGIWLPCGGHVEPNELPDDAAVREVREEAGIAITLVGERALAQGAPRQLLRPRGVQLETIGPGHEHIDLIYLGRPIEPYDGSFDSDEHGMGWYAPADLDALDLTDEVRGWTELALHELA